jgi:hypothetical protein
MKRIFIFLAMLFFLNVVKAQQTDNIVIPQTDSSDAVINPEVPAKFPGNWRKFVRKNTDKNFTEKMKSLINNKRVKGVMAMPVLRFIVDTTGNIYNIQITDKNKQNGFQYEAMRILLLSQPWIAAKQNGIKVKSFASAEIKLAVWF